jgi:hypothetical protein
MSYPIYDITVIGAGSSGIIAISEILCYDFKLIAWVDPEFSCGKLPICENIPSNAKTNAYIKIA